MKKLLLLAVSASMLACGAMRPAVKQAREQLARCEREYLERGNTDRAAACLQNTAKGAAPLPETFFLLADLLDNTGRPDDAVQHYFKTVELAHANGGGPSAATAAAMGIVAIRDRIDDFDGLFQGLLSRIENRPGKLPLEAWFHLQNLRLGLSRRAGRTEHAAEAVSRAGCLVHWQVAGPMGPWIWTRFDDPQNPGDGSIWPAAVDLGPGRGRYPVREATSQTCFISASNPELSLGGVTWVHTTITIEQPSTVHFRLQTTHGAIVYSGEEEIFRRDPRLGWPANAAWFTANLPRGSTDIEIKLATEHPVVGFSLVALNEHGYPAFSAQDPHIAATGQAMLREKEDESPPDRALLTSRYAQLKIALFVDDIERATEIIQKLTNGAENPTPALLATLSEATAADPSLPGELAYERARTLDALALDHEPRLWQQRINLADRALGEEHLAETISLLKQGISLTPSEPELRRRLLNVFASQGWLRELKTALEKLTELLPTSCNTLSWQLALARREDNIEAARSIAEQLARCDSSSPAMAEELTRAQNWKAALAERQRLANREPLSASLATDVGRSAMAGGDLDAAKDASKNATQKAPDDISLRLGLVDLLRATGDRKAAREALDRGLAMTHVLKSPLNSALAALERRPVYAALRVDGLDVLKRYQIEQHAYDTAAVFVLDRGVYLVDADGGMTTLVHTITQLNSDEAVEEHGEFSLPNGAKLLTARTIKSDGRILEPEAIAGKPSFSMPDLEPGDSVETEYLLYSLPNQIFPGGFDTERFYFQNFKTAFHRSEFIVAAPDSMKLVFDPRGDCPDPIEHTADNLRVLTWKARGIPPLPAEPLSPDATEYLPSIRVTAQATWPNTLGRMRDLLADKARPSRHIDAALAEAIASIQPHEHNMIRRAIYHWVLDNIEPASDMFEQASHIIARRAGNPTIAFVALLRAAGYTTRFALVKPLGADDSKSAVAQLDDYSRLAVKLPDDGWVSLDVQNSPYGYLSPGLRRRPALLVDSGEKVETDTGSVARDTQHIEIEFTISADGSARGTIRETLSGLLAARWRSELKQIPITEQERRFQETYVAEELRGAKLTRFRTDGLDRRDEHLVLEYEIEAPGFARPTKQGHVVRIPFPITSVKQIGGLPARVSPLVLASHIEKSVTATIASAGGRRIETQRAVADKIEGRWGGASRWVEVKKAGVKIGYRAELDADRISAAEYMTFVDFAQRLDRICDLEILISALK